MPVDGGDSMGQLVIEVSSKYLDRNFSEKNVNLQIHLNNSNVSISQPHRLNITSFRPNTIGSLTLIDAS